MGLFSSITDAVKNTVKGAEHVAGAAVKDVGQAASSAVSSTVKEASSAANSLFDTGKSAFNTVAHGASSAVKDVGKVAKAATKDVSQTAGAAAHVASNVVQDVGQGVKGAEKVAGKAVNGVENLAGKAVNGAENLAGKVVGGAANVVDKGVKGAENLAGKALKGAASTAQSAASSLGHAWNAVAGGVSHTAQDVGHGISSAVNGASNIASGIGKSVDQAYHGARADLKQGLTWGFEQADKAGLGKALDGLGLGGVNQANVDKNHQITDTYTKQSKELQNMLGPGAGANWATFASWASNRAGQAIQNHDDPGGRTGRDVTQIASNIPQPLLAAAGPLGMLVGGVATDKAKSYDKMYQNESTEAAKGNQKVFKDISPRLQQFTDTFKNDKQPDQKKWNEFAASFHGQEPLLLDGFKNYYAAKFQSGDQKAQSITLGNLQMGLHEQQLLQPEIQGAFPPGQGATYTPMQTAKVGENSYNLGRDIPGSAAPQLQNVTNPQLKQFLAQHGPSGGQNLQGSAAKDWTVLPDRMKFITGLFMSRYNDPSLFSNPRA